MQALRRPVALEKPRIIIKKTLRRFVPPPEALATLPRIAFFDPCRKTLRCYLEELRGRITPIVPEKITLSTVPWVMRAAKPDIIVTELSFAKNGMINCHEPEAFELLCIVRSLSPETRVMLNTIHYSADSPGILMEKIHSANFDRVFSKDCPEPSSHYVLPAIMSLAYSVDARPFPLLDLF